MSQYYLPVRHRVPEERDAVDHNGNPYYDPENNQFVILVKMTQDCNGDFENRFLVNQTYTYGTSTFLGSRLKVHEIKCNYSPEDLGLVSLGSE